MRLLAARAIITGVLLSASSSLFAVPDTSQEAVSWLGKMAVALRTENYDGIFTYMRGTNFDTVRIVHRFEDGAETERLYNLNGEVRELRREDNQVQVFYPVGSAQTERSVPIGPFNPAFSEQVIATQNLYRLSMHGEDRIAGRYAVTLQISPKFDDRYGYRVWLDKETGLMLQSHKVERGRIREIFQFTNLSIGEAIPDSALASEIEGETISHQLALGPDLNDRTERPSLNVRWLPDGFRAVRAGGNRLHYTDGVATFSIFIDRVGSGSLPDLTTRVGGTVVITRSLPNVESQVTVVGDVPVQTAQRVAESIEPIIY